MEPKVNTIDYLKFMQHAGAKIHDQIAGFLQILKFLPTGSSLSAGKKFISTEFLVAFTV